nr:LamG domain-containing protein [Prolixibacteraceae bacterium]
MYRRKLYNKLLVVSGLLLVVCGGYAQITAVSDYNSLGGYIGYVSEGIDVCPSHGSINSTNTFSVEVNDTDAGDTWFEWVVYGGTIIENNGVSVNPSNDNDADDPVVDGVPYFYIEEDNYTTAFITFDSSEIVVQWHSHDLADSAWVAVRQISQWGCTDSTWSVFTQRVYNQQPEITDFPDSITIAYDDRSNYTLPLPTAFDPDACFDTLTYHFTITGASDYDSDSVLANRTVDLGVGENTVTWTISDLMKDTVRSYTITVDPMPQITNIAWTNPTCFGNSDGTLYISDVLDHNYGGTFQYALAGESDTTFTTDRHFTGLWEGDTTVYAMIEYNVDLDNDGNPETTQQLSDGYTINLYNSSEFAVNYIPDSTSTDVSINNAGCLKDNDGSIEVLFDNVTSLNNSLSFDGVDDYLLLNKRYDGALTDLSVAAWINVPADNTRSGTIISFDKDDYFQLRLSHAGSNSYVHFVTGAFITGTGFSNSSVKVNDGKWHLVVATYDQTQQIHSIYVDGVKAISGETNGTIGSLGNVRYGMIGASAEIDTLINDPRETFFYGSIAEVAIWDNQLLTDEHVDVMMKEGMLNNGVAPDPSDHWALNDIPSNVQGSAIQDSVFTDIGNIQTESHWGRFYNGVGLNTQNSPTLLSWTDNLAETTDSDYPSTNELTELAVGKYTLHVKNIFGCGELSEPYSIKNSDAEGPELYWNVALRKNADQYDVVSNRDASLAVDGYGLAAPVGNSTLTTSQTNAWWKVDLGAVYSPVYKVRIFTGQHGLDDFYVLASNSYPFNSPTIADVGNASVSVHYQVPVPAQDTVVVNLSNIGANVRYLCIMLDGEGAISLAEVEVLCDLGYTVERNLYLAGDSVCTYQVSSDDASIIPYAFDECDGIVSLEHDANIVEPGLSVSDVNLNGAELALGSHVFEWLTFDDANLSDSLKVTYTVHDTINPSFNPYPFLNSKDTITYCQSLNYKLPITKVFDNYYSCDIDTPSIKDLYLKWSYSDETIFSYNDSTFGDYNPNTINDSVLINRGNYLLRGDRIFVWQAADYSNNTIYDSLYLHVEERPLVNEMSISPASCIDGETQAIFTRIQSEEGRDVNYIMYNVTEDDT